MIPDGKCRVNVTLPIELQERLRVAAAMAQVHQSAVVEAALLDFMDEPVSRIRVKQAVCDSKVRLASKTPIEKLIRDAAA